MMLRSIIGALLLVVAGISLRADTTQSIGDWDSVTIGPIKTSIYIGSVKLTTGEFRRSGDQFSTTYEAKVWPWFFWSETGRITITMPPANLVKLAKGERIEFTGEAFNHKNKPRKVTGRADRANDTTGKIKVRIEVDDTELVFNGSYRFNNVVK